VLAVIEHQQQPAIAQVGQQRVIDAVCVAPLLYPQRARECVRHKLGAVQLGQLDPPDTIGEMPPQPMSGPQGEPTLADSARSRQRDHARG